MVALYVGGKKVDWADAERVLNEPGAFDKEIDLRNEAGRIIGRFVKVHDDRPLQEPLIAFDPPSR